jgi:hypothetical protein
MRLVVLESPYAGHVTLHINYAKEALLDCLNRHESPIASHLLFTQSNVLKDDSPSDRAVGIRAGHAWIPKADAMVVYTDRGISKGMQEGIDLATKLGILVEYRSLYDLS